MRYFEASQTVIIVEIFLWNDNINEQGVTGKGHRRITCR